MREKILLLLLPCLVCACSKQEPGTDIPQDTVTGKLVRTELTVSYQLPSATKMHIEGLSPIWDRTDSISLFGSARINSGLGITSMSGSSAAFSGNAEAEGPFTVIFPYSTDNSVSGSKASFTVPAVQQLSVGRNVASGALACVGTASTLEGGIVLKNVMALMKVTITDEDITSVMLTGTTFPLAGRITVSSSTGELSSVENASPAVTLLPDAETFAPGSYYIATIPGTSEGVSISVRHKADARRGEKTTLKTFEAKRNTILNLGSADASGLDWAYRIYSREDLEDYKNDNANWSIEEDINLCADIDMRSENWTAIEDNLAVSGTFEGNGHCIYNIKMEDDSQLRVSFFGKYFKSIRNLTLGSRDGKTWDGVSHVTNSYNASTTTWTYAAGCIAWPGENTVIENVKNFCNVTTTAACTHKSRTGGLICWIEEAGVTVRNCANYGTVTLEASPGEDSNVNCGGVASGINAVGVTIDGCTNCGPVTSKSIYTKAVGGIVGQNYSAAADLVIKDCSNRAEVSIRTSATHKSEASVGGIIGKVICKSGATPVQIKGCENHGYIYSNAVYWSGVGGIAGWTFGSDIVSCTNFGKIENNSGSGRYQAVGGIAGMTGEGYGNSTIRDCINRGEVLYQGKSFGQTKNASGGEVRGVNAGGIVGLTYPGIDEISGNVNYGSVTGINSYAGTKSYPKAYMFVGGIVGYDYGKILVFDNNKNMESAIITSMVTDKSSTYTNSYAVAGGIIGYQKNSTMLGGMSLGTVRASYVSSTGLLYAGSISAWNKATISMCNYGGTVNGVAANASNTVGNGNAPLASAPASATQTDEQEGGLGNVGSETDVWD